MYLRNELCACGRHVISAFGGWPLIRGREPTPYTQSCLALAWILPVGAGGKAVSAPRPYFMAGHGFQKEQGMVAGRKASTSPTSEHLPRPFLLK